MRQSYRFVVTGRVQGVWFRQSTRKRADELGVDGWVRNCRDGAVEGIVASDSGEALADFRQWLHRGPPKAVVQSVSWDACEGMVAPGFEVRP
ncbi:MAG: acylphosphatase [Panacagrimonas sp.]